MTGKRLLKRITITLALATGLFIVLAAGEANATPIRPDIRKVVSESQSQPAPMVPARAGWNGPEMQPAARTIPALDPSLTLRANKAALLAAAIPDPRALFAVAIIIILMRTLKRIEEEQKRRQPATVAAINDERERIAA